MIDFKSYFLELTETDKYHRVYTEHPVAWYFGLDGHNRCSLFAITETQPWPICSSKLIDVFIGARKDQKFGITFSLTDKTNLDLFVHFCFDMINHTRQIKNTKKVAESICSRYVLWQKAFRKTEVGLLSFEEIKGLIGELCFLKMKMIPFYGVEKAVASWSGIEATDQDFICDDTWYEVKTTISGSSKVKISSVEQLDVSTDGHLAVVVLDKTSEADISRITLNSMVDVIIKSIDDKVLKDKLQERLLTFGYCKDKAYDSIGFRFNGITIYSVNEQFPCLRQCQIPESVKNVKYELSLPSIEIFKEE